MAVLDEQIEKLKSLLLSVDQKIFTVTWLNHYSLRLSYDLSCTLENINLVGIDGLFLHMICKSKVPRTSADIFLPKFLAEQTWSVGLIGGPREGIEARRGIFVDKFPNLKCKFYMDGFSGQTNFNLIQKINEENISILIIGMGTPQQEWLMSDLIENKDYLDRNLLIFTCGGWLEQIIYKNYYPSWAYRLKMNWLIRLVREPRRLWKRYFVDSVYFFRNKSKYLQYLSSLPGYLEMEKIS